jgi:predicted alpha/beta superfamily hydrolase
VHTGQGHTFLGGSSLGGLVSLEIAQRHPNTFAGVIAMSPSLWWNGQSLPKALAKDVGGLKGMKAWLDCGSSEEDEKAAGPDKNAIAAKEVQATLSAHGVTSKVTIEPGAKHNEEAWARRFPDAIQFILNP